MLKGGMYGMSTLQVGEPQDFHWRDCNSLSGPRWPK